MATKKVTPKIDGKACAAKRAKLKLGQSEFWGRVGISQSMGSRIEKGTREINQPVHMVLGHVYFGVPIDAYEG